MAGRVFRPVRAQRQCLTRIDVWWPEEHALFEPLREQAQTPVPEHDLDQVGFATAKHEQMAREGILPQHALDQHGEPVDSRGMPVRLRQEFQALPWRAPKRLH
jgi:hypothetical protein